MLAMFAPF